jgi:hypothetical protein
MKKNWLILFGLLTLSVRAQNTQGFHNIDFTNNRVVNIFTGPDDVSLYSLSWHLPLDSIINNSHSYYKISKIDTSGILIANREIYKNGDRISDNQQPNKTFQTNFVIVEASDTSENYTHYINYIKPDLAIDSFVLPLIGSTPYLFTYCKYKDKLIIISSDSRTLGDKAYVSITDTLGNEIKTQRLPYEYFYNQTNQISITPLCLISDENGGFISGGWYDTASRETKINLFGIDSLGNKTWEYKDTRVGGSFIKGMQLLPDKTILAYGGNGDYMYLAKFSQHGQLLNENFYYPGGFTDRTSGSCYIVNVKIIDGYIYAVGSSHNMFNALNTYSDLGTLLKTDLDGNPIWAKQFGNYYFYNILDQIYQTSDCRLLLAGFGIDSTQLPLHGVSWYVSTDTAANETLPWCQLVTVKRYNPFTGIHEINTTDEVLNVSPNPTSGVVTIYNPQQLLINQIQFLDVSGNPCQTETITTNNSQLNVEMAHLKQGLYYLKISTPKGIITKKIVKQ